jgi:hypothetical protein
VANLHYLSHGVFRVLVPCTPYPSECCCCWLCLLATQRLASVWSVKLLHTLVAVLFEFFFVARLDFLIVSLVLFSIFMVLVILAQFYADRTRAICDLLSCVLDPRIMLSVLYRTQPLLCEQIGLIIKSYFRSKYQYARSTPLEGFTQPIREQLHSDGRVQVDGNNTFSLWTA